jgi:enoyl-CoA hydratase
MTDPAAPRSLRVDRDGPLAEIVLLGPGKGNAMGPDLFRELPETITALCRDESVRAVILRGNGGNFSYGLDLKAMVPELGPALAGESLAKERLRLLSLIGDLQRSFDVVESARFPVIAAIDGWCIGGGIDLVAACDVRVCTKAARFSVREVRVAMVADLGSLQRLPRIIGQGHTRELAFTGRDVDAARALRIGLVNDVYDDEATLLAAARAMAREIAENPPLVVQGIKVQGIKAVLHDGDGKSVAEGLRHVALWNAAFLQSHDLMEAFAAFAARRPPKFEGR